MCSTIKYSLLALSLVPVLEGCDVPVDISTGDQSSSQTSGQTSSQNCQNSNQQQGSQNSPGGGSGQQGGQQGGGQGPCNNGTNSGSNSNQNQGQPYNIQVQPGQTYLVVDEFGTLISPTSGRPMQSGDHLIVLYQPYDAEDDALERAYVQVFETMAPISDALKFYPNSISPDQWSEMTEPLQYLMQNAPIGTPTTQEVLECAQNDSQSPGIEQYLVQAELALKCSLYANTGVAFQVLGAQGQVLCEGTGSYY